MHKLLMVRQCVRYPHLTLEPHYVLDCRGGISRDGALILQDGSYFSLCTTYGNGTAFRSLAKACEADKSMDLLWAAAILALHGLQKGDGFLFARRYCIAKV